MDKASDSADPRIEALLKAMNLQEKISLLSGRDLWRTAAIERLGIPSLVLTDGPHGVRSDGAAERPRGPATSFPTGVSMACSWDTDLIERVGEALAEEARAMGCDILLGPCVNIVRGPLAGRNFESYSEDPFLAGRIAVCFIKGVQSRGIGTSLKHFALNNQETERGRGSSEVEERTMREIYLRQFEMAVKEAQPWTLMCSYNRIRGQYASENTYLLTGILRHEWGFEGVVVSDWGANHTTVESMKGGLDLEMPGPALYYGKLLEKAVDNWQVDESLVDEHVRRILAMVVRSGKLDDAARAPSGSRNTPRHQELARELEEQSIVLLRNEGGLLPLDPRAIASLAVVGPNAAECRIGGGGSSFVVPPHATSPLEAMKKMLGNGVRVLHAEGCTNLVEPAPIAERFLRTSDGKGVGLSAEYFPSSDFTGAAMTRIDPSVDFLWIGAGPEAGIQAAEFSARWAGFLIVPAGGSYRLTLNNNGSCRLWLDGRLVLENAPGNIPMNEMWDHPERITVSADLELEGRKPHAIRIELVKTAVKPGVGLFAGQEFVRVCLCCLPPAAAEGIAEAAKLAARCDAAIVCVGMPTGFESEGRDRPHMDLPGAQNELVRAVLQANPRTVIVLNTGAPVALPWAHEVPALLQAHYMGQEGGDALARVVFGDVNPSGKLSLTYPKRLEDNPTFASFPGAREVLYGEGIYVGYRYYDVKDIEPLFPFGFGLSYSLFEYGDLSMPEEAACGETVEVSLSVRNVGARQGREVVQLYVGDCESSLPRPPKELKGFSKLDLKPGETRTARFILDSRAFSFYDPYRKEWIVEPGVFQIMVGSSSRDIRSSKVIRFVGPAHGQP